MKGETIIKTKSIFVAIIILVLGLSLTHAAWNPAWGTPPEKLEKLKHSVHQCRYFQFIAYDHEHDIIVIKVKDADPTDSICEYLGSHYLRIIQEFSGLRIYATGEFIASKYQFIDLEWAKELARPIGKSKYQK